MAAEVVWADVVLGAKTERLSLSGGFVRAIKVEPTSMTLVVEMEDDTIRSYLGCPYVLCTRDDGKPDLIIPEKEIITS